MIDKSWVRDRKETFMSKECVLSYCKTVTLVMLPFGNISEKFMLESFECKVTTILDPDELGANASM